MPLILKRLAAKRDLVVHFAALAEGSVEAARRFRDAAEKSFGDLAAMPRMGAPRRALNAKFAGLRMWRVRGFESYLIFYRPLNNGVAIERVIHAKQDHRRILK
jgi:toxin ParE1/3/4